MGQNFAKRAAEIVAGLRALVFPGKEAFALSSFSGRLYARILKYLNNNEAIANTTGARQYCMTMLATKILSELENPESIVEIAAGFSSRALHLAKHYPQANVVEIDHANVVKAKQKRVNKMEKGCVPQNLSWLCADLGIVKLPDLLGKQTVDLVTAEGVFTYFTPEEIVRISASVRSCLKPKGIFITDILSAAGWQSVKKKSGLAAWVFNKQVGRFKGAMPDQESVRQLFLSAGFEKVTISSLEALTSEYLPALTVADTSFIVAAYNI